MKGPKTKERHLDLAECADLKGKALKGGGVVLVAQVLSIVLRLGSIAILARLLSRDSFGLIAMVAPVTGFVALFANLGLTDAVVQRKQLTQEEVSSVFWMNLLVSVMIAGLACAGAPMVAGFFGRSELFHITLALSLGIVFSGLAAMQLALLRRQMRMVQLSYVELGSLLGSLIVGVIAALNGFGYWSLVFMQLTAPLLSIGLGWALCGWRPLFVFKRNSIGPLIKFGFDVMGFNLVNFMARNLDKILIGRFSGAGVLGLYSRAYQTIMFPIVNLRGPINSIGLPVFSRLQEEPDRFRVYYRKLIQILGFVSIPLLAFCAACSGDVVLLVFGDEWSDMVPMFTMLAICGIIQPVASIRGMVLISLGQTRRYFHWGLANAIAVSIGAIVGIRWGGVGVASAYAAVNYLILVPSLFFCFRKTNIKVSDFFREIAMPVAGAVLIVVATYFLRPSLELMSLFPRVVLLGLGGGLAYMIPFVALPQGRAVLRQFSVDIGSALRNTKLPYFGKNKL